MIWEISIFISICDLAKYGNFYNQFYLNNIDIKDMSVENLLGF